ncbi:MAG: phosphoenolpyruvate carboxykinase (GTP) [Planctomycetes bacterium]|nr:phosphoenolpyruvate carboxykinase (GTP) [Planctomycetota bacterium]
MLRPRLGIPLLFFHSRLSRFSRVNRALQTWVDEVASVTKPQRVVWCDGSDAENERLIAQMLADETLQKCNPEKFPNSYYHRSHPSDVARTEHLTFISTDKKEDAGPTNNWMSPEQARERVWPLFSNAMKGRTMYVVPYVMGPLGSPFSKVGIEITDSAYVAISMRIMTRMGKAALDQLGDNGEFVKGLHSLGDLSPERRFIVHFPQQNEIWSIGSGYGGNALLGKKCFALRIAGAQARREGWLAEHMLILGIQEPSGETHYVCAAFPSACGKTNLAMLVPPASFNGYKIFTVGDDIAWIRFGPDGRLWAVNPEAGFFGVAPGTSEKTNPNAMATIRKNSIFTNTAFTSDGCPWWDDMGGDAPAGVTDWKGNKWIPGSPEKAAHPNSRFTAPARQCPSISPKFEDPLGVPISAFIFGARRASLVPLVYESFDWNHGVYVGSSVASETTAAATGAVGVLRRDPFAMLPFCGYNMGDYFSHWLTMGAPGNANGVAKKMPKVFHVNWFRKSAEGKFLWPGFGENIRVLQWILERSRGKGTAVESPIGYIPAKGGLNTAGLQMQPNAMDELLRIDPKGWAAEAPQLTDFYNKFGDRLPAEIRRQHQMQMKRLGL